MEWLPIGEAAGRAGMTAGQLCSALSVFAEFAHDASCSASYPSVRVSSGPPGGTPRRYDLRLANGSVARVGYVHADDFERWLADRARRLLMRDDCALCGGSGWVSTFDGRTYGGPLVRCWRCGDGVS